MTHGSSRRSMLLRLVLLLACALPLAGRTAWGGEILVSAATSLTDVMKQIGNSYELQSKHKVSFNFASSSALARQIEEGAPVDLFLSANLALMDRLEKNDHIVRGTRKNLLSNQLVLIAPVDWPHEFTSGKDLLRPSVKRIALAQPTTVPAGVYAKQYLENQRLWSALQTKIVPLLDVRATLAAVESGNVDVGFVYKTDAAISRSVRILMAVPPAQGPTIVYPLAVARSSRQRKIAADFHGYLFGAVARKIFEKHGFLVLRSMDSSDYSADVHP